MNPDYKLIRNLVRTALHDTKTTFAQVANHLDASRTTIGNWMYQPQIIKVGDMDDLLQVAGFGQVTLRQPYDSNLTMRQQLVTARRELGVSVPELSVAVGASPASFYLWEKGHRRGAPLGTLELWARFLGMGGLTVDGLHNSASAPIELFQHPTNDQALAMDEHDIYYGHRYIPWNKEHALLRIEAWHRGIRDDQFHQIGRYKGQSLSGPKFRTALLKLAIKHGTVDDASERLIAALKAKEARMTLDETP